MYLPKVLNVNGQLKCFCWTNISSASFEKKGVLYFSIKEINFALCHLNGFEAAIFTPIIPYKEQGFWYLYNSSTDDEQDRMTGILIFNCLGSWNDE